MPNPDPFYLLSQLERRLSNLIKKGRVHSVREAPPRVRVEYDKDSDGKPIVTRWLPYFEHRAGHRRDWDPPKVGEQATIFSEGGDLNNGVVQLGLNTLDSPPPSSDPNEHVTEYADGTKVSYNRDSHHLTVTINSGDATLNAKTFHINADINHTGNTSQTGNTETTGTVTAAKNITSTAGEIADKVGAMSDMRDTFNQHGHEETGTTTEKPNQEM